MIKSIKKSASSDFDSLYNSQILPVLKRYESYRQALFNKAVLIEILVLVAFWMFYYISENLVNRNVFILYTTYYPSIFYFVLVAALGILIWVPIDNYKRFKSGLKKRCSGMLKKCFGELYWGHSEINETIIRWSELFAQFNRISYDDKFNGLHKGVPFSVAETNMLYITEGRRRMVFPVFKGVIISFKSNKNIKAQTIVTTKWDFSVRNYNPAFWFVALSLIPGMIIGFSDSSALWLGLACLLGFVIMLCDTIIKYRKFGGVKLEDLNFDKRFSVYSQNQIEARYLITPAFMDRLNYLRTSFGTKKIKCAFFDDQIVFAISTNKDLFELGDFHRSLLNKKKVKEFYDEIMAIYNMIDYFKLDEKTGL